MLYWLHVSGGTHLRKYDWDAGPWPKADALALRARIIEKHPNLAAGISPAWEGPFEDMIRVKVEIHRFGKTTGHKWVFIYRATEDRYFVFMGNLRVGLTIHRKGNAWTIGSEIGGGTDHSLRLSPQAQEEIERQLLLKSPDGIWDSGWTPASPDR